MTEEEEPLYERRSSVAEQKKQMTAILWFVGAGTLIMLTVTTTLSIVSLIISKDVKRNSDRIALTALRIEQVEQRDRDSLRGASYRTCEREQRDRAEQHLRAGLSPPAVVAKLVKQLGLPNSLAEKVSVKEVRKRLPIFDCSPNLIGKQATPLSTSEQKDYVDRYSKGELDPTP